MAKSRKAKRAARREKRQTINWAAKFHEQYAVALVTDFADRGDDVKVEKVFYCLAFMYKGRAALQALAGEYYQDKRILTVRPKRLATDGDLVIARLAGELSSGMPHPYTDTSCKALKRKIEWWRKMQRRFKCECGFETDNQANFDYHRSVCRWPKVSHIGHRIEKEKDYWSIDWPSSLLDKKELKPEWNFHALRKSDKVMLGIIFASVLLWILVKVLF